MSFVLYQHLLDNTENNHIRSVAASAIFNDCVTGSDAHDFIYKKYQYYSSLIEEFRNYKDCFYKGKSASYEPITKRSFYHRLSLWVLWIKELYKIVQAIESGQTYSQVNALTFISLLEGDLEGFKYSVDFSKQVEKK